MSVVHIGLLPHSPRLLLSQHLSLRAYRPWHKGTSIRPFLVDRLTLLLLLHLQQKGSVDVRQHTTKGDGGTDESIELLIATNGELKVAGSDTLDFEILGGVASKLKNFSCQVFEDSSDVDGS